MSLDVASIRSFLVASPKPAKILITSGDGERQEVLPPKGVGGVTWAQVARSIEALDPAKLELFDAQDRLIRAHAFDANMGRSSSDPTVAELPEILKRDAESARLALFGKLLADAYRFSVDTAFTKMVELTERLDERQARTESRLERVEASYRRAMQDKIDDALDEAEEATETAQANAANPLGAMVEQFVAGATQGQQDKTTNGKKG